jgi:hypothetical protein
MSAEDYINFDFIEEDIEEDEIYLLKKIEVETEKAYKVRVEGLHGDELFWVPKSQIIIEGNKLLVPAWLNKRLDIQIEG